MYNSYEGPTTLGIAERWERVLCYALGFIPVLGWISGLVMLIIEQKNHNVRRHAAQSMIVFGALGILGFLVVLLSGLLGWIPLLGGVFGILFWVVGRAIWVVGIVLWLLLLVMAYARPNFFLPLGRTYERLLG
jgi:uncharacterized membrane protein